jgi:hypothetical protein
MSIVVDKLRTPPPETPGYDAKLFGRKWKVSVLVPKTEETNTNSMNWDDYILYVVSDSTHEDTSLRVTFNIQKFGYITPNFSEICIYNMKPETEKIVIKNGCRVLVEAGYVSGDFGVIYSAPIFQPLWEREDNVTTKVTLRCIDCLGIIHENHVEMSAAMLSQQDMVVAMAAKSRNSYEAPIIGDNMDKTTPSLTKLFFDSPHYYMRQYCQKSGTTPSYIDGKAILDRPQDPISTDMTTNALVVSPGVGGLIGTPQQTQDGITFTLLLNPLITIFQPPMLIKIDNAWIRQMQLEYGTVGFSKLDEDGIYRIIGVTHVGDTRGNPWYSNCVGINQSMEGMLAAQFQTIQVPSK